MNYEMAENSPEDLQRAFEEMRVDEEGIEGLFPDQDQRETEVAILPQLARFTQPGGRLIPKPPTCHICHEQAPADCLFTLPCKHTYCPDCLVHLFTTSTRSLSVFPPTCCGKEVYPHAYRSELPDTVLTSYLRLSRSKQDNQVIPCATPTCNKQRIDTLHNHDDWALCETCLALTCTRCGKLESAHPDPEPFSQGNTRSDSTAPSNIVIRICPPATPDADLQDLATTQEWQTCPRCKSLVERIDGCAEMHCRCGQTFCYTCGMGFPGDTRLCNCPMWPNENIPG